MILNKDIPLNIGTWDFFEWQNVIKTIDIAKSKDLNSLDESSEVGINYISRSREKNGIKCKVMYDNTLDKYINKGGCITVPMVGESTCYSFYQKNDFIASQNILILKDSKITVYNAIFINTLIRLEAFRFCYGRTLTKTFFKKHIVKLPVTPQGNPDWQFMENYIKSLPYSSNL